MWKKQGRTSPKKERYAIGDGITFVPTRGRESSSPAWSACLENQ